MHLCRQKTSFELHAVCCLLILSLVDESEILSSVLEFTLYKMTKFQTRPNSKHYPITTQCIILTHLRYIAVKNIVRIGEISCNKQFLLFSQSFLCYMALILHLKCILKCGLQFVSIWTSLKFGRLVMG